jgi:hypothetical protein
MQELARTLDGLAQLGVSEALAAAIMSEIYVSFPLAHAYRGAPEKTKPHRPKGFVSIQIPPNFSRMQV